MSALRNFLLGSEPDAELPPAAGVALLGAAGLVLGSVAAAVAIAASRAAPTTAALAAPPPAPPGDRPMATPPTPASPPVRVSSSTSLDVLRGEYATLWRAATLRPERRERALALARLLAQSRGRYEAAGAARQRQGLAAQPVPWQVVAVIHSLEGGGSSGRFTGHLHNGDPLTARTVHVPANRPATGEPPFTWEASAFDALSRFDRWSDWSLAGTLYQLERYNGTGYRQLTPPVATPYLWSWTSVYAKGKITRDHGGYDPEVVSAQCGAAAILKAMEELSLVPRYAA